MTDLVLNELKVAQLDVVQHAAHDFAATLAAAPQFCAFEEAAYAFQQDGAAQAALQAYQAKQQSLQMMLMLNAVNADDRAELTRLSMVLPIGPVFRLMCAAKLT